jgi:hypothetical protein
MRWRTPLMILFAVALIGVEYVYLPYIGWSNSDSEARERVTAYLTAVVRDTGDRGWNLLEGSGRSPYGSEAAYRATMAGADWTDFAWEFGDWSICDDGICTFILRLPNGIGSAPREAWSNGPGNLGVLRTTRESTAGAEEAGDAYVDVLQRGWFGGIGVVVSGAGTSD